MAGKMSAPEGDHLTPASEGELSGVIAASAQAGRRLRIIGGGTRLEVKSAARECQVVSSRRIAGIVDYEPGALTLVARAGTPISEIEAVLETEGQALAFEPMDHRLLLGTEGTPTIGGVIGANVGGPRRLFAGACRDHVLGTRFVDGNGRICKNGGRVMKNVTGLDLSKLLCGSFGTLGILTEIALKTAPISERQQTLVFSGVSVPQASSIFVRALATPFEISGAAYNKGTAWIRIEGFPAQIAYRRERLTNLFREHAIDVLEELQSKQHWLGMRDLVHFARNDQPVWRILVRPTDAPAVALGLEDLGGTTSLDWGGGLLWYRGEAPATEVRRVCAPGHAMRVRDGAADPTSFFPPESDYASRISQSLRRIFDPAGILNSDLLDR